jgi:hypothetical protein
MNNSHVNMLNHIAAHVNVAEARMTKKFESAITHEKEPFLKEIIESTRNGKSLETKYTASDILVVLERLQESLPSVD